MSNASIGDNNNNNIGDNKFEDFQFSLAALEEEDNYNNKNNNWDSLSDLGFVPSDFDPTPLDTLLLLNQNHEEGDNDKVDPFVLTELLDSLGCDIMTTNVKEEQPCSITDPLSWLSIMKTEKETQSTKTDVAAAEPFLRTFTKRPFSRS